MSLAGGLILICWVSFGPVELVLKVLLVFCPHPQLANVSGKNSSSSSWSIPALRLSPSFFRPVVKVFLHVTGTTCGAHEVIMEKLHPLFWKIERTKDWQESDVFLVFCPVKTRPGADVDAAMRNLPGEIFLQADLRATSISRVI